MISKKSQLITKAGACALLLSLAGATSLVAQDEKPAPWVEFGGPTAEYIIPFVPETLLEEPELLWEHPIKGQSYGPIAADDKLVIVPDHDGMKDYWNAYDAKTGEEKWVFTLENSEEMDFGASPRAMPLLLEDKVIILNAWGHLLALNREDGSVIWQQNFQEDYDAVVPIWGWCSTPVITDNKLIVNPGGAEGGIVALNPDDGSLIWNCPSEPANYSSFLVAEFGGIKQIITYDDSYLLGINAETGERVWEFETSASSGYIVPNPVKIGEQLLLVDDEHGTRLFNMVDGKLDEDSVVESYDILSELATPVVFNDMALFLFYEMICADPKTLEILWRIDDHDPFAVGAYGTFYVDPENNRVLVYSADGSITLLNVSRESGEVITSKKLTMRSETVPAIVGNIIYCRDDEKACYAYKIWE